MNADREPIATRVLQWTGAGESREVVLRVWAPLQVHAKECTCDFAIDGLPEPVRAAAHGIDSLHALTNVTMALRSFLEPHRKHLSFLDEPEYYGIPLSVFGYSPESERHLEAVVEAAQGYGNILLIDRARLRAARTNT